MKIISSNVAHFISNPPESIRSVLIYGSDRGLVKEYQKQLTLKITKAANDPFLVSSLEVHSIKNNFEQIALEACQISLMGGRKVILIDDADDSIVAGIENFLQCLTDTFLIIQSGGLKPTSKLRKLYEAEKTFAAVACFSDDLNSISKLLKSELNANNISIDSAAFSFAVSALGVDRSTTRSEIEKLILYSIDTKTLDLRDVKSCIADSFEHNFDDVIYAAAKGDTMAMDFALSVSFNEGVSPIAMLRVLNSHLIKLHRAIVEMELGKNAQTVSAGVFFKRKNSFIGQLRTWRKAKLLRAIEIVKQAEIDCKKTSTLENSVACRAFYSVAYLAK